MDLEGKKINFLGDSITEGYGASDESHRFTEIIERETGAVCRNYGIGGTCIARRQDPGDGADLPENRDFCSRIGDMDPDADIVVVFGGTNDYGHGDARLGRFSDRTPDTFCGALNMLFTGLIEKYPQSEIVILTPLHRTGEDNYPGGNEASPKDATLLDYVELIRQAAQHYSLPVLDLYATSGMQPEIPVIKQMYVPDGLHPNNAGHARLARLITSFLRNL